MKRNLALILILNLAILAPTGCILAGPLYWDGGTINISANGDGVSQGGAGAWNTTVQNWDQGAGLPHIAWNNALGSDAYFGGATNTVTLGAPITANSLTFATTNGYIISDGGNSANTLSINAATNNSGATINANIVNSGTFATFGTGSLTVLSNSPGFTGSLSVNAGTLQFGDGVTYNGPTGFGSAAVAGGALFMIRNTVNTTIGGTISGAGVVEIQNKSGIITTLTGNNSGSGTNIIASGELSVASIDDVNPSNLGTGPLQVGNNGSAANFIYTGPPVTTSRPLLLGGNGFSYIYGNGGPLTLNGPLLYGPNSTLAKTLELRGIGGPNFFACTITNNNALATSLAKQDANTWVLTASNSFSGGATFNGNSGTLLITSDAALGASTGSIVFTNGASTIGATNNPVTLGSARTVTVYSTATATFSATDTNNFTVASLITGPGKVVKGSLSFLLGAVRFNNDANNYTGDFSMGFGNTEFTSVADQGTPSSLGEGATATGGAITLGNSTSFGILRYVGAGVSTTHRPLTWTAATGSLELDNTNTGTIKYLSASAMVTIAGSKILMLNASNTAPNELHQLLADSGGTTSVIKEGAGEWILSGANTYSGATTVNGGTLLINGSLGTGSPVTVTSGTLGGNGTIGGPVTVNVGGTLAAGDPNSGPLATLTINNALTNLGTIYMKLNKSTASSDQITGVNTMVYGGTLSVSNLGGTLTTNDSFQLFTAASYQGTFGAISPATPGPGLAWDQSSLAVNGKLKIAVGTPANSPNITSIVSSGSNIVLSGTNGPANGTFYVQMSTNLASTNWTAVATNSFDTNGTFNVTNSVSPVIPAAFFRLILAP